MSDALWDLLRGAGTYRVTVIAPDGAVRHGGAGAITVEDEGDRIVWRESGRWETGPLAGIRFHNSTNWERGDGASLTVHHLRRGDDQPTFLARLEPSGDAEWRSVEPHLCGEDQYHAAIRVFEGAIEIVWVVESPSDPYSMSILVSEGR